MRSIVIASLFLVCVVAHSEYLPALLRSIHPRHFEAQFRGDVHKRISTGRLSNARNITGSGTNAECYWSNNGKLFSFQAIRQPISSTHPCDLIYTMNTDGSNVTLISPVNGRTTCSYVLNDGQVIYSSTMSQDGSRSSACPPAPDYTAGYLWPIYHHMQIYVGQRGGLVNNHLVPSNFYDAESTLSPDGKQFVFTSARDGDLELYIANVDGTGLRRMTYSPGYDGGAYFSHSGKMLCWRANRPQGQGLTDYLNLLNLGLVAPVGMQLYVMDINDPNSARLIGPFNGTNFAPSFLPDDSGLIFSSNMHDPEGGSFQLYTVNLDGSNLQQITDEATWGAFNAFPQFNPVDKKTLAFASSAGTSTMGDINIWLATLA